MNIISKTKTGAYNVFFSITVNCRTVKVTVDKMVENDEDIFPQDRYSILTRLAEKNTVYLEIKCLT